MKRTGLLAAVAALAMLCFALPAAAQLTTKTVVIANGESLSTALSIYPGSLVAIETPSGWDTAKVSLQVTADGTNYFVMLDDATGAEWSSAATIAASKHLPLTPGTHISYVGVKVQSGTSASPVNQVGAVTLTLVLRRF